MKYCAAPGAAAAAAGSHAAGGTGVGGPHDPGLLLSACWQPAASHLLDAKLPADAVLDGDCGDRGPRSPPHERTADLIDSLLGSATVDGELAELKPLPPFTGYTSHLSINGISGHHYHAIAQRLPEENNNYPTQSGYGAEQNVVSSSTCTAERDSDDVKSFPLDADGDELFSPSSDSPDSKVFAGASADSCGGSPGGGKMFGGGDCAQPKSEIYDISSIEDIAAIIGSAIADTTVPSQVEDPDHNSRDSWMDLDAWIEGACSQHSEKLVSQDNLSSEFVLPHSPQHSHQDSLGKLDFQCKSSHEFASKSQEYLHKSLGSAGSTLQTLLTHGYMPLLQNRLQHGPPVKQEAPSSTSYGMDVISTSSPPGNVVSTTDNLLLNGRYMQHHYAIGLKPDGLCSPDHLLGNYPHTTTHTPISSKNKRNRSKAKHQSMHVTNSIAFQNAAELSGLLNKEKPVHRCNICNRGFLNKSNIKVHLRTHTGEKPFRCEVCAKAFRQKAHLIKHQQIHKRIGRD